MAVQRLECDVLIVGAGPAGLFACHEIVSRSPGARVALVDGGASLEARAGRAQRGERTGDWLAGFGGAGFFVGGRLSYDPSTLTGAPSTLPQDKAIELARYIDGLLGSWGVEARTEDEAPVALRSMAEQAAEIGLTWQVNYPARHLTADERLGCLRWLGREFEASGVTVLEGTRVDALRRQGDFWAADGSCSQDRLCFEAKHLLLAPGRSGARWLSQVCGAAGIEAREERSVGVRVETRTETIRPLTQITLDPRLSVQVESGDFRTYAFVTDGCAMAVEQEGQVRISCRPGGAVPSGRTSLSVLWRVPPGEQMPLPPKAGMSDLAHLGLARDAAGYSASDGPLPTLTLPRVDLRGQWPAEYWLGFERLMTGLDALAPGLLTGPTVVYSPAIETVWTYDVDAPGETQQLPGLWLAGDGAGMSQGAMAAAISGVAAGRAISESWG